MVLGLDLSTKSTGWALFHQGELKDFGCIRASSDDVLKRIQRMADELEKVIQKYPEITKIYVEDPKPAHVNGNIDVYKKLTWLQGQVAIMLNHHKLKMQYTTSSHWRSLAGIKTGRGVVRQTLKKKDIQKVKQLYGLDVNDDEADAILIARAYPEKANIIQF